LVAKSNAADGDAMTFRFWERLHTGDEENINDLKRVVGAIDDQAPAGR
jgi:hypothetical protein